MPRNFQDGGFRDLKANISCSTSFVSHWLSGPYYRLYLTLIYGVTDNLPSIHRVMGLTPAFLSLCAGQ